MNRQHRELLSSEGWITCMHDEVLAPLLEDVDLGRRMLELGPGPGAATAWLCSRVESLVAVEVDAELARELPRSIAATNLDVVVGDCTSLEFAEASFDSVGTFTMLHHLPTPADQWATLCEAFRVLRPGGVVVASDSLGGTDLHEFHEGDAYNPLDPARLLVWLQAIGYAAITLRIDWDLRFIARKPDV